MQKVVKQRKQWLEEEINIERKKQSKKEFEYKEEIEEKKVKVSDLE